MWAGSLGTGDGSGGKTFQSGLRPWVRVGTVDCESLKSEAFIPISRPKRG